MRFVITAGGTREYIDPVRFISNASSGKIGYALARAAMKAGHQVTLISAVAGRQAPGGMRVIEVETTAQMFEAVRSSFSKSDCLIMAAAVADFTPARSAKSKIKKTQKVLNLRLKPTPDILRWAGKHKKGNQIIVGFALEDRALRTRAEKKRKEKNLDMIIANTPATIGSDKSTVQIKAPGLGWMEMKEAAKAAIARRIIRLAEGMLTSRR
jgi:phosphopantothenoylcysteine decarboxylase/phosphopantothenate--cysteine ligase